MTIEEQQTLLKKIASMFKPVDRNFLCFDKEEVITGPNDRAIVGWDNYFPIDWLIEDYGFTKQEARQFIDLVKELRSGAKMDEKERK